MCELSNGISIGAVIISIISTYLAYRTFRRNQEIKEKETLGFLTQFNYWNLTGSDIKPSDRYYNEWVKHIDRFFEIQAFIPKDMKEDYNKLVILLAKDRIESLGPGEKKDYNTLIKRIREEAAKRLEK